MGSRAFYRLRVAFLCAVLFFVVLWAWRDVRSRRERNAWDRPLAIAVVLLRQGPIEESACRAFEARIPALEQRLATEERRYRAASVPPFVFTLFGPIDVAEQAPHAAGEGLVASAVQSWALWRWTARVDAEVGLDPAGFDSRIYVVARPPHDAERKLVEGESQQGGRVGTVEVELDPSMVDFALFVTSHELLHTLGATDKYDANGKTAFPEGLAEPQLVPLFPQDLAEVMARNLPLSATDERPPASLDELGVGPTTAAEIGWAAAPPPPGN